MKFGAIIAAAAVVASLPITASALTVRFSDSGGIVSTIADGDTEDGAAAAGVLTATEAPLGGYTISGNFSVTDGFPPLDELSSTFTIGSSSSDTAFAKIEVSHLFDNGLVVPTTGHGSVANNLGSFAGASVTTEVFLATSLFGTDTLVTSTSGALSTNESLVNVTDSPYYITQVFTITGANNGLGTATAEWTAPATVPVPAGILLMGTALAGLGVMRRRHKKAA